MKRPGVVARHRKSRPPNAYPSAGGKMKERSQVLGALQSEIKNLMRVCATEISRDCKMPMADAKTVVRKAWSKFIVNSPVPPRTGVLKFAVEGLYRSLPNHIKAKLRGANETGDVMRVMRENLAAGGDVAAHRRAAQ